MCTIFSKKDGLVLPTVHICGDSSLQKRVERANEEVKRVHGDVNAKQEKPRGKYEYSLEERAQIGKYDAENGPTNAAKHFSQRLFTSYVSITNAIVSPRVNVLRPARNIAPRRRMVMSYVVVMISQN